MNTSEIIKHHVGEVVTVDRDGHEIIIHDADEAKLAALGKKRTLPVLHISHLEEMARNFNIFSMLGMCFCIIATVDLSAVDLT